MWRSLWKKAVVLTSALSVVGLGASGYATNDPDSHSTNMAQVSSLVLGGGLTEIAFWGDLAVIARFSGYQEGDGSSHGFSVIDISNPMSPRELSRFVCTGGGWDMSLWENLVFLSVDGYTPTEDGSCSSAPGWLRIPSPGGVDIGYIQPYRNAFEGIKIVSIADPAHPVQVGSIPLLCSGSHTNTLVPDPEHGRVFVYAASLEHSSDYPPTQGCDMIVEVPLDDPAHAKVLGALPFGIGRPQCHDQTAFIPRQLLAAACVNEVRLYDISDPANPQLTSVTVVPGNRKWHSVEFTNDGNALVAGEEGTFYAGDTAACIGATGTTEGALWFFDITTAEVPVLRSYYQIPRGLEPVSPNGAGCSAHNFNVVPTLSDRDILITAWYSGGVNAIDFTDLSAPAEIAFYQPSLTDIARRAWYWSAYWYRGHVYATNAYRSERKSLDVYSISDPAIGDTYRLPHLNAQSQEPLDDALDALE